MLKKSQWKTVAAAVVVMALINRVQAAKDIVNPDDSWI